MQHNYDLIEKNNKNLCYDKVRWLDMNKNKNKKEW